MSISNQDFQNLKKRKRNSKKKLSLFVYQNSERNILTSIHATFPLALRDKQMSKTGEREACALIVDRDIERKNKVLCRMSSR